MSYREVVEEVKRWPFYEQLRLMEELARTMQRQAPPSTEASEAAADMLAWQGVLKPEDGRIPTDEEIQEIIAQGRLGDEYWELMKALRHVEAGRKYTREEMNERR